MAPMAASNVTPPLYACFNRLRGLITRKQGSRESTREQPEMYASRHRVL